MFRLTVYYLACLATLASAEIDLKERDTCPSGYTTCAPTGATTTITPKIDDSDFQNLFVDIVHSSLPASKRSIQSRDAASLCCVSTLDCLTMNTLAIPFCYDRFTTNYFLPDGSFGTVVGGNYQSASKDIANLETGDFTLANGTTGNLYSANEAAKPSTEVLPLPIPFTASGVGSAIPASDLGDEVTITFTTTLSQTTIPATTVVATTISTESVIFASVETIFPTLAPNAASVPAILPVETTITDTASLMPISTVETMITITPTTIAETTREATVSVITTTINTASNPAIFGTNVMTATGTTPVSPLVTKKSAGSSERVPLVGLGLVIACGLAGLIFL